MEKRNKLRSTYFLNKTEENKKAYTMQRNKVNKLVNDEKKNSTAEKVKKGLIIYKIYRSTIGKKDSVIYPTDAQNKVAAMNQFFASIGGSLSLSLPRNSKKNFPEKIVNSVVFPSVTESKVQKYIDNMKSKTSCGFNETNNIEIKIFVQSLYFWLAF